MKWGVSLVTPGNPTTQHVTVNSVGSILGTSALRLGQKASGNAGLIRAGVLRENGKFLIPSSGKGPFEDGT